MTVEKRSARMPLSFALHQHHITRAPMQWISKNTDTTLLLLAARASPEWINNKKQQPASDDIWCCFSNRAVLFWSTYSCLVVRRYTWRDARDAMGENQRWWATVHTARVWCLVRSLAREIWSHSCWFVWPEVLVVGLVFVQPVVSGRCFVSRSVYRFSLSQKCKLLYVAPGLCGRVWFAGYRERNWYTLELVHRFLCGWWQRCQSCLAMNHEAW